MSVRARAVFGSEEPVAEKVRGSQWYRALGLGGITSALRLILSFISIKFTAIYLGPTGLALIAQLGNFINICHGILGGGLGAATSRLYPEFAKNRSGRKRFLATSWYLASVFAFASIVIVALGAAPLAQWLLTTESHRTAVMLAGIAVACLVLNTAAIAAVNGAGEMGRVAMSNIVASAVGIAIYVPASVVWGITGGLIGFAISQMVFLPVTLAILHWSSSLKLADFRGPFDPTQAQRILGFVPMLIAHAVMSPLGMILIRDMMASHLGLATAGLWQATLRVSEAYLGVVMASLSLYFLPRLGEVIGTPGLRAEILRTFLRAVGITAVIALALFVLRDWVVTIVFTEEFRPIRDLMPFQLLGDVLRMAAWTLGFVLVALVRSRWYIALEVLIPLLYFGTALILVPEYGAKGATWAYCVAETAHFAVSVFALRDVLIKHPYARRSGNV